MSEFEDGSIEALAASISERESAGHDPDAGRLEALDKPRDAKPQPQEIQPQAVAEESTSVEEPVVETAEADDSETTVTPDPVETEKAPLAVEAKKPAVEAHPTPEDDGARNQIFERASTLVQQLEAEANAKFADIKSEADVLALMSNYPARYNEFVIAQRKYQQAVFARNSVQEEAKKAFLAGEQKRLLKEIPDLADPEKGEALKAELRAYAKSQGIPDSRQARNADEVISLHREMKMAKELKTYRDKEATQAKALKDASEKAAKAPPVQKPGATRSEPVNTKIQELEDRFAKTGRPEDLAAVFAARGG